MYKYDQRISLEVSKGKKTTKKERYETRVRQKKWHMNNIDQS